MIAASRPVAATSVHGPDEPAGDLLAGPVALGEAEELAVVGVPPDTLDRNRPRLRVEVGDIELIADGPGAREALTDLDSFVRERLAGLDAANRAQLLTALAPLTGWEGLPPALSDGLHAVREALRERRPLAVVDQRAERAVEVEALHRIADDEFYVRGWLWEQSRSVVELTAVSPEGERVELIGRAHRHPRPDVAERFCAGGHEPLGFVCHFRTAAPSRRRDGWVVELANAAGRGVETAAALSSTDPASAREGIVADAVASAGDTEALREHHVRPALTRLQELRRDAVAVDEVESHGTVPESPEVSVIVPLFERIDLLEHQLVHFADDPELWECEIVYVLDSPEERDHLSRFGGELARLYGLPFRTATLTANGGVALARNLGASLASGRRLLFLDSDVLPARPGWVGELSRSLDASPNVGAVAPKLLYEDEAVQHAGVELVRAVDAPEWSAELRMKGVHGRLPAANVGGRVPAVTGACMMTDAALYRELAGMSWIYVQGDYEDADFCMRLARTGRQCLYAPEVALYHLEGQSYPSEARAANRRYNRWLFSRSWSDVIEEMGR